MGIDKNELRAKTIKYSKEKRSQLRNEEKALQEELQELDRKICNNDVFDQETLEKYESAKGKLKRIHDIIEGKKLYLGPRQNGSNKEKGQQNTFSI